MGSFYGTETAETSESPENNSMVYDFGTEDIQGDVSGGDEQLFDTNTPDNNTEEAGWGTTAMDWIGGLATYIGTRKLGEKAVQKGILNKLAKKGITKGAGYLVPVAGQVMAAADLLDFTLPEGYSPYEGFGLAPDNALSNTLSWGNVRDLTPIAKDLYNKFTGE
tara:strand:+ start:138 stop:629 length:492 start_codon:yes stop_codon:yes gene_type:complete